MENTDVLHKFHTSGGTEIHTFLEEFFFFFGGGGGIPVPCP